MGLQEPEQHSTLVTTEEQDYTNLAELAAALCQSTISTISFLDEGQLWFKAYQGLGKEQLSHENSFSQQVIESGAAVVIPDTTLSPQFATHPWVIGEPHIRFYTGIPLRNQHGQLMGSLCVMDSSPKQLTSSQRKGLETLAQQVIHLLDIHQKTKELEEKNAILLDNNHLLWGTVSRSTGDLDQLNSELETLLYRASHDMARPLSSLEGLSNLAQLENLPPEQRMLWQGVTRTTEEMRNLTYKFQQISEVLSGEPQITFPVLRIEELLVNAIEKVKERFPEANFTYEVKGHENSTLFVSASHVEIILANLAENTWVFRKTNQKAPPHIRLEVLPADHAVTFSFHDDGMGIIPEALDRIFDMFFRGSEASKGNGLGLYVVARTVKALFGVYSVESTLGQGASFTFSLAI